MNNVKRRRVAENFSSASQRLRDYVRCIKIYLISPAK